MVIKIAYVGNDGEIHGKKFNKIEASNYAVTKIMRAKRPAAMSVASDTEKEINATSDIGDFAPLFVKDAVLPEEGKRLIRYLVDAADVHSCEHSYYYRVYDKGSCYTVHFVVDYEDGTVWERFLVVSKTGKTAFEL